MDYIIFCNCFLLFFVSHSIELIVTSPISHFIEKELIAPMLSRAFWFIPPSLNSPSFMLLYLKLIRQHHRLSNQIEYLSQHVSKYRHIVSLFIPTTTMPTTLSKGSVEKYLQPTPSLTTENAILKNRVHFIKRIQHKLNTFNHFKWFALKHYRIPSQFYSVKHALSVIRFFMSPLSLRCSLFLDYDKDIRHSKVYSQVYHFLYATARERVLYKFAYDVSFYQAIEHYMQTRIIYAIDAEKGHATVQENCCVVISHFLHDHRQAYVPSFIVEAQSFLRRVSTCSSFDALRREARRQLCRERLLYSHKNPLFVLLPLYRSLFKVILRVRLASDRSQVARAIASFLLWQKEHPF